MPESFSLAASYDSFPRIEEEFQRALDVSLDPRGPELLYDLVADLALPTGSLAVDVGCGEGQHALELAARFGFRVRGVDPVRRHVELAERALAADERRAALRGQVRFGLGRAEDLPVAADSVDLVWCRDVLVHVADLDRAYGEVRRVLRKGGLAVVYQSSFATDRLEPREAAWLWERTGMAPSTADPARTDAAIATAGLRVHTRMEVGMEWAERRQERTGAVGRRLLHATRLLRSPERYAERFGQPAYDIMLADCLWHIYHALGKLSARVYVLSRP